MNTTQRLNTPDLERETDLQASRLIREDFLKDEGLITLVRERVESSRLYNEAYGGRMSTDEYVRQTLDFLAEELANRHAQPEA